MSGLVVITGASTGIGRATALHLARRGFEVLAGVRKEADGEGLRAGGVTPVLVDVTRAEQVGELQRTVGDRPLAGLVNNAGITVSGPLEFLPLDELRRQMEVNLVAHVAVTQALLEALRRAQGRIVNTGSVGARTPLPFTAPYAASKAALWALGEALRGELRPWGIHVATIEPGAIATEIWTKGAGYSSEVAERLPARGRELYGPVLDRVGAIVDNVSAAAIAPEKVAETVEHALTARRPRARYLVGRDARRQLLARRLLGWRRFDGLIARRMGL
jgi:NAD(P)-dependent dehydrogenase (short-subunit alcohol dehydrogenase family)